MVSDGSKISTRQFAGLAIDFLVIVVPISLTAVVFSLITVALLPEFSVTAIGGAAILAAVRWLNCRHDEFRAKRHTQVPD